MNKIEILAPAGGFDSVVAAVRSKADAVYLGAKQFSARSSAHNFDYDELEQAITYCHIRGVKVYLTVNTLIFDSEMKQALQLVKKAATLGIDAVIVQDIGLATLIHKMIPDLPLHASTQMSIHSLSGAKALYEMGFKRVVLSREMSESEIREITENCPIETEVFVHGALCMCVSGQCYFSAMLGSRSGNRGACAQPCRLPFSVKNGSDHALSLKDNSIISYINRLQEIGVTSAKIEGRMKRPEYVCAAVSACIESRDFSKVSEITQRQLTSVFARSGFTDGYFTGKRDGEMFGFRKKEDVTSATEKLLSEIRQKYKNENPLVSVSMVFSAIIGENPVLTVSDDRGNSVTVTSSSVCEKAINTSLSAEKASAQLTKTGGTPYFCTDCRCQIEDGLSLALSALNELRRNALTELDKKRAEFTPYKIVCDEDIFDEMFVQKPTRSDKPLKRARFLSTELPADCEKLDLVYLPIKSDIQKVQELLSKNIKIAIEIPRGLFSAEKFVKNRLQEFKEIGVTDVLANNLGAAYLAKKLGFTVHGGFGLNITNTASLEWAKNYGLADTELSVEMKIEQIEELGGTIKRGLIAYGYLPLMLVRNCPGRSGGKSCSSCKKDLRLQDRRNVLFPIICDGICSEILNSVPLLMPERIYNKNAIDFEVFRFTVENYVENVENTLDYYRKTLQKKEYTGGLYLRGIK